MKLINHLMDVSFLPQRTGIFRPQNYLAYACCMKPGCYEMIQSVSPHRAARNTSFSITRYWLLITILIPCLLLLFSLDLLHTIYLVQACMQKFGVVKFHKNRVKMQIWGKPAIFFSWAMSVHSEIPHWCSLWQNFSWWKFPDMHAVLFESGFARLVQAP